VEGERPLRAQARSGYSIWVDQFLAKQYDRSRSWLLPPQIKLTEKLGRGNATTPSYSGTASVSWHDHPSRSRLRDPVYMGSTASRCFSRAYRLIDAAQVVRILSPVGDIQPTSERQIRSLTKLEPEEQREAWKIATAISPKPTAAIVEHEEISPIRWIQSPIGEIGHAIRNENRARERER